MSEFVRVATLSDVPPGTMKGVWVEDEAVALYNLDGEILATGDICSHAHAHLTDGTLCGCEVECPLHGARFDIRSGRQLTMPAVVPIPRYEVRVEGNDILVLVD
ncbi:MAG: non-heme iron oxygenase ferredoxin subunit [Armatimonadetes bacterium]|nr:non-heme iron oxygenase ferredoxin subunit [Armatimonadota bacterium]